MNLKVTAMLLVSIATFSGISHASETENYIRLKGVSSIITKPDVAHCFLVVADYGKNYEVSAKAANKKLDQLKTLLKATLKETPDITILKIDNKPRG